MMGEMDCANLLVAIEERLQVVEPERTPDRDGLCRVSGPEQAVWVAAQRSQYFEG